jgi:hypothetical protein
MTTKIISTLMIATFTALAITAPASAKTATQIRQEAIEAREARQEQAIVSGRKDGSLTYWEKVQLNREQRRIAKLEAQALADGKVSRQEYLSIKAAQNDAGRHITAEKHDAQVRGWWWRTFSR